METATTITTRYIRPGAFTRHVLNPLAGRLTRWGISLKGSRILEVRGRTTGELRSTVVNLLIIDGDHYLVAPRGETQWVRNLRAAGTGTLRVGRHEDAFAASEVDDAEKTEIIRTYLREWGWEVGKFFDGLDAASPDEEIRAAAPGFPVFRLVDLEPEHG